ncbi:hypothetical protein BP6252_09761 [Coleophoma cylindrospora]|uniref:Uncharacterized protein n=1 Tax=Coleophoma cylindrospora TaxID=1849047 RepID=A0A3D8QWG0_9HELO|nr:hypothetical protein BP6252_09761 [Coleophoma cylindrospora]
MRSSLGHTNNNASKPKGAGVWLGRQPKQVPYRTNRQPPAASSQLADRNAQPPGEGLVVREQAVYLHLAGTARHDTHSIASERCCGAHRPILPHVQPYRPARPARPSSRALVTAPATTKLAGQVGPPPVG